MSILVDDINEEGPGDIEALKRDLAESQAPAETESEPEAPELPEKYRNKSLEDIVEMHRNAESELGRRANELGQYKKLTDELLDLKRRQDLAIGGADRTETEDPLPAISSSELLDDPNAALDRVLSAREQRENARREREAAERARLEAESEFANQHPDATEIANDPSFLEWVKQSPAYTRLGQEAAQGDLTAASVLLSEWKSRQTTDEANAEPKSKVKEARAASTESTSVSAPSDAPNGKVYRRLDLIRLKLQDPEAYGDPNFQQEIMRAYAEGRVK